MTAAEFCQALRAARLRAKLTQAQLAERLGVAANTLARWERGERVPPSEAELPLTREAVLSAARRIGREV